MLKLPFAQGMKVLPNAGLATRAKPRAEATAPKSNFRFIGNNLLSCPLKLTANRDPAPKTFAPERKAKQTA
jgi:hypothetical protein